MKAILSPPPQLFQAIFHDGLVDLAREVGFVRRLRDLNPVPFARLFVLTLIGVTRLTFQDLAAELGLSAPAVCKRLQQPAAATFFARILERTLAELGRLLAPRAAIPALASFRGIYLLDGTILRLPTALADRFAGTGGGRGADDERGRAAVKVMTRFRLDRPGELELVLVAARRPDLEAAARLSDLPAGALVLADLGFFDGDRLAGLTRAGVFWLTRLPPRIHVRLDAPDASWCDLLDWLESLHRSGVSTFDGRVWASQETPFPARLLARRCPDGVAAERRRRLHAHARRKGKSVSRRQSAWCDWWVLATNAAPGQLSIRRASELYRSRWQIELMFKRWKSLGQLRIPPDHAPNRALCELYARLTGVVILEWLAWRRGGPLSDRSAWLGWKAALRVLPLVRLAAEGRLSWQEIEAELDRLLRARPRRARRKKHPSTRQRLFRQ